MSVLESPPSIPQKKALFDAVDNMSLMVIDDEEDGHFNAYPSQEFHCFLSPVDEIYLGRAIRVTWEKDLTFSRSDSGLGFSKDGSKFVVNDAKVSSVHCRVTIRNDTEIWLIDSSTNGTLVQRANGERMVLKRSNDSPLTETRLEFGDLFALSVDETRRSWKFVWQVCRSALDSVTTEVPRLDKGGNHSTMSAKKNRRSVPTPETMARVAEGEAALAAVLKEAATKSKKKEKPKVVTSASSNVSPFREKVAGPLVAKKSPDELKKQRVSIHELATSRKQSNSESIVLDDDDDEYNESNQEHEEEFIRAAVAASSARQKSANPSPVFSLSIGQ